MKLCMIGTGYVGLVSGVCFSDLGNDVICVDKDINKINLLKKGKVPIYEPGLSELVIKNYKNKKLKFSLKNLYITVGIILPKNQNFIDKLMKVEKLKTYILSSLTFTPSYVYRTDYWYKSNCYFYWILS